MMSDLIERAERWVKYHKVSSQLHPIIVEAEEIIKLFIEALSPAMPDDEE